MEDWVSICIVVGVVLLLIFSLVIVLVIKSNSKNIDNCVWTDKKRTLFGLPISFTRYILTERKLITRKGFFNLQEDECDIYRIIDKRLELPLGQRIFNCGTIVIHVKDADNPIKEIKSVKNVREVMQKFDERVEAERAKYRVQGKDMIGFIPNNDLDIIEDEGEF